MTYLDIVDFETEDSHSKRLV